MYVKIYIDESPPGSGKTYRAIESIVARKCKVIFSVERIERFIELEDAVWKAAKAAGFRPTIRSISSSENNRHGSVVKEVDRVFDEFSNDTHVIVFITHAALLNCNFKNASGWEVIVDEVPNMLDFQQKKTHLDVGFFESHYQLKELAAGWSSVKATEVGRKLSLSALKACESHAHLAQFHQRVVDASHEDTRRIVICNLANWKDMAVPNVQWCWSSTFSFRELEHFDRVTLLGNCFRSDISFKISEAMESDLT